LIAAIAPNAATIGVESTAVVIAVKSIMELL
jgi:hypothetical protein